LIEMQNIKKVYKMGDSDVAALDGVSLNVGEGEFTAIIGPSGSGKSTLMNIIGCLDTADSGKYLLDGQDITTLSDKKLGRIRSLKIGFIFQQFNLLQKLTAFENVELPLIYQGLGKSERHERAAKALELVGLGTRIRHRPNELSGGQQQRVAIARAIASKPSIILADEPTGNLDSKSGREIIAILHSLHETGNTILLITHDEKIAAEASRRVKMADGRITFNEANGSGQV
jgi:putative ABC transport system ATP-binding protein